MALIPISTPWQTFDQISEPERSRFFLPGLQLRQHTSLCLYNCRFPLEDFFVFSFVRNPWDRAVSQIEYLRAWYPKFSDRVSFKERLRTYCNTCDIVRGQNLGACQLDYLEDATGKVRTNFIGRYESLAVDFSKICSRLDIDPAPVLPHANKSGRTLCHREYYDKESREWVRTRFAKDIAYFGYKF